MNIKGLTNIDSSLCLLHELIMLIYINEFYLSVLFNCVGCGSELNSDATKKALVKCADLIVESTIDPNALARKLNARDVISENEYKRVIDSKTGDSEEERREKILGYVKDRVKLNADIFTTFLKVLKDDLGRDDLADKIMAKYKSKLNYFISSILIRSISFSIDLEHVDVDISELVNVIRLIYTVYCFIFKHIACNYLF